MSPTEKIVCEFCIGEEYLHEQISVHGKELNCSFCKRKARAMDLAWLAEAVHSVLEEHFYITPTEPSSFEYALINDGEIDYEWYRKGQPLNILLQDIVTIDEPIADDIQEYLSDNYTDFDDFSAIDEHPYGDEAHYEESPAEHYDARDSWSFLCSEIKSRTRFFSTFTEKILDELFGDLHSFKSFDGTPVVRTINLNGGNLPLYRGRIAQSEREIEKILGSPVNELGPPSTENARAGRMNPHGISVFYGATDPDTCIAEVRPPVGSHVVLGKFEITQELRLLDMDILTKLHMKGSYFNPESGEKWGRAAFLRQVTTELTKPILPDEEELEYLPTQAIAEYLSEKIDPRIDGIIFQSSQITKEGKNVVLFNHASSTEPYKLPDKTKVDVNFGWATEDDYDDSITVWENVPDDSDQNTLADEGESVTSIFDPSEFIRWGTSSFGESQPDSWDFTLKLEVNDIEVRKINGVSYETHERMTSRHRFTKSDKTKF